MTTTTQRLHAESLFDSVGPAYESAFADCTPQQTSINWLLEHLPANSSVLDIGCGTGRPVCASIASAGHKVHGIDVSGVMLTAAKTNVPNATFEKVDIKDFSPPNGVAYDAITVYFSLIVDISKADIKVYIARIYSWLKKGGLFIFATVPISGESMDITWLGRHIVASSLSVEEAVDCVKSVGFEVLKTENSKYMPKAVEAKICEEKDCWEEEHVFVHARK